MKLIELTGVSPVSWADLEVLGNKVATKKAWRSTKVARAKVPNSLDTLNPEPTVFCNLACVHTHRVPLHLRTATAAWAVLVRFCTAGAM